MLTPYLFVGLGGSGGKTLQYLKHFLQTRLDQVDYQGEFPKGWKFIWFDVPTSQDLLDSDLGIPELEDSIYSNLVENNVDLHDLYNMLTNENDQAMLNEIRGWLPDPDLEDVPLEKGAGMYRAVGRMITLTRAQEIRDKLSSAVEELNDPSVQSELNSIAKTFGYTQAGSDKYKPTAVFISSIAGGSGAGSIMDIPDVLRGLPQAQNWQKRSYAFLYTPDVFDKVDKVSVQANSLATLSEIMNGFYSYGEAVDDSNQHLLNQGIQNEENNRGPMYPFLLGRKNEDITFPTAEDVFKNTARSLVSWVTNENVKNAIDAYAEANRSAAAELDNIWEANHAPKLLNPFQSLGYASVTIGRTHYRDYIAERISYEAVQTLARAHYVGNNIDANPLRDDQITSEEAIKRVVKEENGDFINRIGLNERGRDNNQVTDGILHPDDINKIANNTFRLIKDEAENINTDDLTASSQEWIDRYQDATDSLYERHKSDSAKAVVEGAQEWENNIQQQIVDTTLEFITKLGAPTTVGLLKYIEDVYLEKVIESLKTEENEYEQNLDHYDEEISLTLGNQRGKFDEQHQVFDDLSDNLSLDLTYYTEFELRRVGSELFRDVVENLLVPLRREVENISSVVSRCYLPNSNPDKDRFNAWAKDKNVPKRIIGAKNEFLLDDPDTFENTFYKNLEIIYKSKEHENNLRDAVSDVLRQTDTRFALIRANGKWVPKDPRYRKSDTSRSEFSIAILRDTSYIQELALLWIRDPGNQFNEAIRENLKDYLNPGDTSLRDKRLQDFKNKLQEAIKMSQPLINVDNDILQRVHNIKKSELSRVVTDIPVRGDDDAENVVKSLFRDFEDNEWEFSDNDQNQGQVEIFSMFKEGYDATVFGSIWRPILNKWRKESKEQRGILGNFWNNRRARPLRHFIPISKALLETMIRGWFIARLLDKIKTSEDNGFTKITIDNNSFPCPLFDPRPKTENILGAVLESIPISFAIYSQERAQKAVKSLDAYKSLIKYGTSNNEGMVIGKDRFELTSEIREQIGNKEEALNQLNRNLSFYKKIDKEWREREKQTRSHDDPTHRDLVTNKGSELLPDIVKVITEIIQSLEDDSAMSGLGDA